MTLCAGVMQVLGLPASEESVRPPADRARVQATFHLSTSAQVGHRQHLADQRCLAAVLPC